MTHPSIRPPASDSGPAAGARNDTLPAASGPQQQQPAAASTAPALLRIIAYMHWHSAMP